MCKLLETIYFFIYAKLFIVQKDAFLFLFHHFFLASRCLNIFLLSYKVFGFCLVHLVLNF